MNKWVLKVKNSKYRITEIEFYLRSDTHSDDYTHGHELQKKFGGWYFHGSGLDITFGNNDLYGGILIRAIYNLNNKPKYTYGPIKVVTELFSNIENVYYHPFSLGIIRENGEISIKEKPIATTRIGLNRTKNPIMEKRLYRFLVMPKLQHGGKTKISETMKLQGYSDAEIKGIWG